jgi:hypothetical protein
MACHKQWHGSDSDTSIVSTECVLEECVTNRPSYRLSLYELLATGTLACVLDGIEPWLLTEFVKKRGRASSSTCGTMHPVLDLISLSLCVS